MFEGLYMERSKKFFPSLQLGLTYQVPVRDSDSCTPLIVLDKPHNNYIELVAMSHACTFTAFISTILTSRYVRKALCMGITL